MFSQASFCESSNFTSAAQVGWMQVTLHDPVIFQPTPRPEQKRMHSSLPSACHPTAGSGHRKGWLCFPSSTLKVIGNRIECQWLQGPSAKSFPRHFGTVESARTPPERAPAHVPMPPPSTMLARTECQDATMIN